MPANISLAAAEITDDTTGEVLYPQVQIIVRAGTAQLRAAGVDVQITGIQAVAASGSRGTWTITTPDRTYGVRRLGGRCCGGRR